MLATDFDRIVALCANNAPTRYFNDGLHDQSYTHFGLWVYCDGPAERLIADLAERGMVWTGHDIDGRFVVHKFIAEKTSHADKEPMP
jgi:hypothetical protein